MLASSSANVTVDVTCPRMEGTVLPLDSMAGRKKKLPKFGGRRKAKRASHVALLAAAGLDLFREGLLLDGVYPQRHTPRHPAVSPNLKSIPEDDADTALASQATTDSQVILILGDALDRRGQVTPLGAARISRAAELYWDTMKVYAQHQANAFCYLAPTGGENETEGIVQTEAIRNELVEAGISPHHIMMDCSATTMIDNVIQLLPSLRHLRIERVHVVTSSFQIPRAKLIVDSLLGAVPDMTFTVAYSAAYDVLSEAERANREAVELRLMENVREPLDEVLRAMKKQRRSSIASTRSADSSSSRSRSASPIA
ncbi:hypothetical protein PF005_g23061 [Phytophthora fragariae]|uniref:DUF218 domain-containing protein n=1 Tax=Phytophthora fragariae TaxID=53985 RepID=A0A6A4C3Z1_9STRA|nr:hypothetical protein PF003_g204 [Phytophthora fragariae]KAE8925596.1 hypothetical protein PF009_g24197 [Phytophthora fragariae]KAE8981276.1 hypothetical protein PF011_g22092 [Phytophthora fragariae]KAE9079643.1 hypothetical protein PF010_g22681 [Phytophthora fragariae]KAE9079747.1 hypothetical protein PF007_g23323 [Phytophthora fragariae]